MGAALGISVSATETAESSQIDILAQNVVYGEKVSVAYAVDASVEDAVAGKVKVSYYLATDPSVVYEADLRDTTVSTNLYTVTDDNGTPDDTTDDTTVSYPVFETLGFAPQDFTDVVCAVAYTGDSVPEGATYKEYSVAEYLYSRLYKDGFINKTDTDIGLDGKDYKRKVHYENMMAYGASAQDLIDGETETLITDYCYLFAVDDTVTINGAKSGLFKPDTTVAFAGATKFILTDLDNNATDSGASYTAVKGIILKVEANNGDKPVISDFEDGNTSNDYISHTANGSYIGFSVADDPTGAVNKVLQVERTSGTVTHEWTTIKASNSDQTGNCITFETKMYVGRRNGYTAYLRVYGKNSSEENSNLLSFVFQITDASNAAETPYITIKQEGSGTYNAGTLETDAFVPDKWVNVKLEFYRGGTNATTYTKLFIDGICVLDGKYNNGYLSPESYTFDSVRIWQRATAGTSGTNPNKAYFDDMYVTKTDKAYEPSTEN